MATVGAAMTGLRPIVEIMYMDFTSMAMDPIVGQAAKWRYMTGGQVTVPVTVRTLGVHQSQDAVPDVAVSVSGQGRTV